MTEGEQGEREGTQTSGSPEWKWLTSSVGVVFRRRCPCEMLQDCCCCWSVQAVGLSLVVNSASYYAELFQTSADRKDEW